MSSIDFKNLNIKVPSPIVEVKTSLLEEKDLQLFIKREDQIHFEISGNKWRKLKYNLIHFFQNNFKQVVTFGGVFSNHIYATAAACYELGIPLIIYLRTDKIDPNNPTLQFVQGKNAQLICLSRESYREKDQAEFIHKIHREWPNSFIIPEGGSNHFGLKGTEEIMAEVKVQLSSLDIIALPAGTAYTAAGIISTSSTNQKVEVFSALKGLFLQSVLHELVEDGTKNWVLYSDEYFGGYAKVDQTLLNFIDWFFHETSIPLDPIYNAKAMYYLFENIKNGKYSRGSRMLYIHTGGLQGITGYNYMKPDNRILIDY